MSVSLSSNSGRYAPPPVAAIPVWYSLERNLQYVAYAHPFHWIQPELANAGRNAYQWGYYYEEVPALEDPDLCYGIHIQIRPTTYGDLVLSAESCEPGGARRQMNFTRIFSLASVRGVGCSEGDAEFYDHLKTLMLLRWLPEARLLMVRALQMADSEERLVLRCVHGKEALSLVSQEDFSRFTAEQLAERCGWHKPSVERRRGIPDCERVLPYLQRLVEKQMLVENEGEYHTPEYLTDRVGLVLYAPVVPQAEWLALHQIPGVIESTRLPGSGGRAWLQDLLKGGRG